MIQCAEWGREDVSAAAAAGIIKPTVWKTYPLADVATTYDDLNKGASAATISLKPWGHAA